MTEGFGIVVYGGQVSQRVVISGLDVIYSVCSWSAANVADCAVSPEDYRSPGIPIGGEPLFPGATLPGLLVLLASSLPYCVTPAPFF
jgi:hypothetical protein